MVQVMRKATSVLCSDKFWLYAIGMLSHQSNVSCKILKFTESRAIHLKVVHHFDNELQNIPDSWTHFLYYFLADYVPLLRHMIHRENVCCYMRKEEFIYLKSRSKS